MLRTLAERYLGCIPGSCCMMPSLTGSVHAPDVGPPVWAVKQRLLATYENEQQLFQSFLFSKTLDLCI